jgi:hypothetical protein
MANSENTAINDLIARVTGATAATGPAPEAPPEPRAALHEPAPMHTTYPASMPVAAPFEPQRRPLPTSYPVVPRSMLAEVVPPSVEPLPPAPPAPAASPVPLRGGPIEVTGDPAAAQSWRPSMASQDWTEGEHMVGTLQLRKRSELRVVVGKLVLPIIMLVVAGGAIGGFVAFRGGANVTTPAAIEPAPAAAAPEARTPSPEATAPSPEATAPSPEATAPSPEATAPSPEATAPSPEATAPSPEAAATPQEATVPSAEPIIEPAKPPALVEVRIDSTPSGATVMLVDRGKSQFVGTTPVNAAVDPSREYDLVFSWASRPAQQEHLDPRATRRIAATLGKRAAAGRENGAPRRGERTEAGEGTLMISSKPPCEILIDGKPTGLTTPQRAIALPAGNHKVTLINRESDRRKTISVQITASATEKVIEDLMK